MVVVEEGEAPSGALDAAMDEEHLEIDGVLRVQVQAARGTHHGQRDHQPDQRKTKCRMMVFGLI